MEDNEKNGVKKMSDKQRRYIVRLLMDKRVDKDYKAHAEAALQSDLTSQQASKIIDFLKNLIDFKLNFVDDGDSNRDSIVLRRSRFENSRESGVDKEDREAVLDYTR